MKNRLAIRLVLLLFSVAILILGYQLLRGYLRDPDLGTVESAGWIAAIENLPNGSRAVVFNAKGEKFSAPGWEPGVQDSEPEWRPDGHRVFFVSNRGADNPPFNIFRWNLATAKVEQRSMGSRSKSSPIAGFPEQPFANDELLITVGGKVMVLNQNDGSMTQILPPVGREVPGGGEQGSLSQFNRYYAALGDSFTQAVWGPDREVIYAKMRSGNTEVLIMQSLEVDEGGFTPLPIALLAGKNIYFDVAADGRAVAVAQVFQFPNPEQVPPEFIVDGVVKPPFRHVMVLIDPGAEEPVGIVAQSPDDGGAFGAPAISPDAERIAVPFGTYGELSFKPDMLVLLPMQAGVAPSPTRLAEGRVSSPNWSPDGETIVYLNSDGQASSIYTVRSRGGGETRVTSNGDYRSPEFSPQLPD